MTFKLIHWVNPIPADSGMQHFLQQLVHVERKLGIDAAFANCEIPQSEPKYLPLYNEVIPTASHSESLDKNVVNILHDGLPLNFKQLRNTVSYTHGTPLFICKYLQALDYSAMMAQTCDMTITRWSDQLYSWKALAHGKPVHLVPPGVDLDLWKPDPSKRNPNLALYADTYRAGIKEPWNALYRFALYSRIEPNARLRLVNIPDEIAPNVRALVKHLRIENTIVSDNWERVNDMRPYYQEASDLYSVADDNVRWEATACGCRIHLVDAGAVQKPPYDIRDTISEQQKIFESAFFSQK